MDETSRTPQRSRQEAASRRRWLAGLAARAGRLGRAASALLLLDTLCAIGFAACLASAIAALPRGLAAATPWMAGGVAASLARGACAGGSLWIGTAASGRVRASLRRDTLLALLQRAAGFRQPVGELMALGVDAVEATHGYIARFAPSRSAAALAPLLVMAAAGLASPVCAGLMALTLIPFIALMILAGGAAADQSRRQFAAHARLSGLFADRLRALPAVLTFEAEPREVQTLACAADALRRRTLGVLRVAFVSTAGLELFAALSVALVAVYVGFNLLGLLPFPVPGHLGLRGGIFVLALAPEFYAPMRRLAASYHDRQMAETAAEQLMALRCGPPPVQTAAPLAAAPVIRFEAVSIRYPGEDAPALAEFDLLAEPGRITALLGPSGSGKTSALSLLLGLAPLAGGEVWVDGRALSELGSIARSCGWMSQTPLIRAGSIADNIALARLGRQHAAEAGRAAAAPARAGVRHAEPPDTDPSDAARPDTGTLQAGALRAEIGAAAQQAGLCAMLRARPGGLDHVLDERGGGLSGGERRRIGLARVLLSRAPVLLLDEPTAHLDPASEQALLASIRQAARGRTTIIATHSPAVASIADRVVTIGAR